MSRKKVDISQLNLNEIGGRVAYVRLLNGLSMEEFGNKIGLSKGNISRLENNLYDPSFKSIVEICKHFDVSSEWLLFNTDDGHPKSSHHCADNVIEIEHSDIIKRFLDKPLARDVNHDLVELEKMNAEAFQKVASYIKGMVEGVRISFEAKKNDKNAGMDRRSGQDRRKVVGGDQ